MFWETSQRRTIESFRDVCGSGFQGINNRRVEIKLHWSGVKSTRKVRCSLFCTSRIVIMWLDGAVIVVIYHITLFIWITFLPIILIVVMKYNKLMRNRSNFFSIKRLIILIHIFHLQPWRAQNIHCIYVCSALHLLRVIVLNVIAILRPRDINPFVHSL